MSDEKAIIMAVPVADAAGIFKSLIGGGEGRGAQGRGGQGRGGQGRGRQAKRSSQSVRDGRVSKTKRSLNPQRTTLQVPILNGYQIVGDSIASRLTPYCSPPLRAQYNQYLKSKQVGFIVHGQTSCQLSRHLQQATFQWSNSKVAVLIGTNDVLKNVPLDDAKKGLKTVVSFLAENAEEVIVMTIPPIPRHSQEEGRMQKIKNLNSFIAQEAAKKDNVQVLDIYSKFILIDESINVDMYEKSFKSGMIDLIHPNASGMEAIKTALIELIAKAKP